MIFTAVIALAFYQTVIAIARSEAQDINFWTARSCTAPIVASLACHGNRLVTHRTPHAAHPPVPAHECNTLTTQGVLMTSAVAVLMLPVMAIPFIFGGPRATQLQISKHTPRKVHHAAFCRWHLGNMPIVKVLTGHYSVPIAPREPIVILFSQGPMPSIAARAESDLNLPLLEQQQQQQSRDAQVHRSTMNACWFSRLCTAAPVLPLAQTWYVQRMYHNDVATSDLCHVCKQGPQNPVEMSPLQCLRSADFWMLFAINGICSGAGLTLLNNVGQQVGAACWCGDCQYFAVTSTL